MTDDDIHALIIDLIESHVDEKTDSWYWIG